MEKSFNVAICYYASVLCLYQVINSLVLHSNT